MRLILSQLDLDPEAGLVNLRRVEEQVRGAIPRIAPEDVLVLPELVAGDCSQLDYDSAVGRLATQVGCLVVGGSHYASNGSGRINRGSVATPDGRILCRYEKVNPYGVEHERAVAAGSSPGWFEYAGRQVVVLLCADLWFSRVFHSLPVEADVVLVSSFSVSQKPEPRHPRALWQHMAVSRAYEFGAFVGISDWAHPVEYAGTPSSGVAGLATPNPRLHESFFRPVGDVSFEVFELDFGRLDELRADRRRRGFV
jgi:predicted amidohydrolase